MAKIITWIRVGGIKSVEADPPTAEILQTVRISATYYVCDEQDPALGAEKKLMLTDITGTDSIDTWWASVVNEVYTAEGLTPP